MRLVTDDRAVHAARLDHAGAVNYELDDYAQPVLVIEQGSLSCGKLFGEHGKIPYSGVHRCRFASRVLVDRRQLGRERIYVGDADHDLDAAIGQPLGDLDLIEIARRVVIDRRPEQASEVAYIYIGGDFRRMVSERCELFRYSRRKLRLKAVLDHDFFRDGFQVAVIGAGIVHALLVPGRIG